MWNYDNYLLWKKGCHKNDVNINKFDKDIELHIFNRGF